MLALRIIRSKHRGRTMEFAYRQVDGAKQVTLSGRFVYADAGKVHDIIADWDFAATPSMTLDVKFITFVDSTAIGMLFLLAGRVREAGGVLTLRNPSPSVTRTLLRAEMQSCVTLADDNGPINPG